MFGVARMGDRAALVQACKRMCLGHIETILTQVGLQELQDKI